LGFAWEHVLAVLISFRFNGSISDLYCLVLLSSTFMFDCWLYGTMSDHPILRLKEIVLLIHVTCFDYHYRISGNLVRITTRLLPVLVISALNSVIYAATHSGFSLGLFFGFLSCPPPPLSSVSSFALALLLLSYPLPNVVNTYLTFAWMWGVMTPVCIVHAGIYEGIYVLYSLAMLPPYFLLTFSWLGLSLLWLTSWLLFPLSFGLVELKWPVNHYLVTSHSFTVLNLSFSVFYVQIISQTMFGCGGRDHAFQSPFTSLC